MTTINTLPTAGALIAPRAILQVGSTVINWTNWDIEHNGIYEAGTITVQVPSDPVKDWPWWMQQTEIIVDVYAGFPQYPNNYTTSDLTLLQTFRIDEIRIDAATSMITLVGRDLTSLLTDQKTDAKYPNMTAAQIATALAKKVGLSANVQPTKDLVGHFYTLDHVSMHRQQTMWTLLTYLAQHEGLQCFVLGRTLYFGTFAGQASTAPYLIDYDAPNAGRPYPTSNATKLIFAHDLTLAQDVSVRVRSYHGDKNAVYSATATANKTAKRIENNAQLAQTTQRYDYTIAGLTQAQCDAKAQQILSDISKHELKMQATLPGDDLVYPWTPIIVQGTNTPFDTTYEAARIRRRFEADPPKFEMTIHGKTVPAQQTVTLS